MSELEAILRALRDFFLFLAHVLDKFIPGIAAKLEIEFQGGNMNLQVGQKVPFSVLGTDSNGNATTLLAAGASLAVNIGDLTVASIAPDPTPASGSIASGVLTALLAGTTSLTASIVNADGTAGPTASASVAVTAAGPGPVANLQIAFGVPA